MLQISKAQLAVYAAALVAIALIGARYLNDSRGASQTAAGAGQGSGATGAHGVRLERADGGRVTVHVAGSVRRPGVYRLDAAQRVDDAVRLAGGATSKAELSGLNLAAKVEDGRQIVVPTRGAPGAAAGAGAGVGGGVDPAAAGGTGAAGGPVNLNTATLEQLDQLDGVGPGIAQKILQYRQQHGGFKSVDELNQVSGIGEKRLASLRAQVTV